MVLKRLRVLLADDHSLMAEGVRKLLESRFHVVAIVNDGEALLEKALALRPDLILTDLTMPGIGGLEAVRRLHLSLPDVPVIVLTMHDDAAHVRAAFAAGASGYLVKSSAPRELFEAIEEVVAGRRYLTSALARSHPVLPFSVSQGVPA